MGERLSISIQVEPNINYAHYRCNNPIVKNVRIENLHPVPATNLRLVIRAENGEIGEYSCMVPTIQGYGTEEVQCADIHPSLRALSSTSECYDSSIYVEVYSGSEFEASASAPVKIDPLDRWLGDSEPESLAAFVLPNHPCLAPLQSAAVSAFEKLGGNPRVNGYDDCDCRVVRSMAEAAFRVLCEQGITYSKAPVEFGGGQRIRLCNEVLNQKLGTCIDLALLYTSLLESMHLNTILFVSSTHCWAGVWLANTHGRQIVYKRVKAFADQIKQGNAIAVECTGLTKENALHFGITPSTGQIERAKRMSEMFEAAVISGNESLSGGKAFRYCLDIACARKQGGITPLPISPANSMDWESNPSSQNAFRGRTTLGTDKNLATERVGKQQTSCTDNLQGCTALTGVVPNFSTRINAPRPIKAIEINLLDISASVGQEQVDSFMKEDLPFIIDATVGAIDSDTSCDFGLKTFSTITETIIPPTEVRELAGKKHPRIVSHGVTNMAEACEEAIKDALALKEETKRRGIQPGGTLLNIITDGNSTNESGVLEPLPSKLVSKILKLNTDRKLSTLAIGIGSDINQNVLKQLGPATEIKVRGETLKVSHAIRCLDNRGRAACWQAVIELLAIRSSNLSKEVVFVYEDDDQEWMDHVDVVALDPDQYEILF